MVDLEYLRELLEVCEDSGLAKIEIEGISLTFESNRVSGGVVTMEGMPQAKAQENGDVYGQLLEVGQLKFNRE